GTRRLAEWMWAGAIGDIREVHSWTNRPVWPQGIGRPEGTPPVPDTLDWNLWLGPATERPYHPDYLPFNWRAWYDFGCGALGDMGCHVLDPVFHAMKLKYPEWVQGSHSYEVREMWKRVDNQETYPSASMITYQFPERGTMPALRLTWYDGGLMPVWPKEVDSSKVSMEGGSMFIGDKGIIVCSTYGGDVMMFPEERFLEFKDLPASLPRIDGTHEQDWINGIKNHTKPCSDFDYSGPLTEMVLMGNLAIRVPGKRLMWDGDQMKVTNDEAANRFIHNDYRSGWVL
ncbi:MAG: gfo/Idh/MocA family oxidoreductase, partial [Bacteroidales bacterium]|nr:gfo/Idh/MocA family oxidoreductase [Bacteroidales bacterium]